MDVGARLTTLRLALGYKTQTAFAKKYGFAVTRWNNYEKGLPLPMPVAIDLVRKIPDLSLDWIYFDNSLALGGRLREKIDGVAMESGEGLPASRKSISSSQT